MGKDTKDTTFEAIVRLLRPDMVRAVDQYATWKCTNFVFLPTTCKGPVYLKLTEGQSRGGAGWCKQHLADELGITHDSD